MEHYCEVWIEEEQEDCGQFARFRISEVGNPYTKVWWVCADHVNELIDDSDRADTRIWEEV